MEWFAQLQCWLSEGSTVVQSLLAIRESAVCAVKMTLKATAPLQPIGGNVTFNLGAPQQTVGARYGVRCSARL